MTSSPLSELVRSLLKSRGVTEEAAVAAFLTPDYEQHTHSHSLFSGMDIAAGRVIAAMRSGDRIAVYADFDCDGIPGAAVLSDLFTKLGYENFEVYLPHRDREGYGFHEEAVEQLASRGVKLIITVDVGTAAIATVKSANEIGIDTIITDHHEILAELPEAFAVLNPKISPYPFPHLCGAAVAFKLAQGVIQKGKALQDERFASVGSGWEKWLLDLVAIATIADMVPLIGENRVLAHWGLQVLRKSPRPGISALCTKLRLRKAELTEDDIGFSIAPRVNAASRMGDPHLALRLLTTRDPAEAEMLAASLEKLNASRKGVVAGIVREAKKRTAERFAPGEVVVLGNPEWKPSLLGLAANSIMSERGGVVCLWGRDVNGKIKGSCRSDGVVSVVELFSAAPHAFEEFGGHAASGGFTVVSEQVHSLQETLAKAATSLQRTEKETLAAHDALVSLREIAWPLYRDIARLAPFGMGNPKPIFRVGRIKIAGMKRFGKEQNHVEVALLCTDSLATARAFDFFRGPEDFTFAPVQDALATVLATVERDTFRGGLALRLVDILPA